MGNEWNPFPDAGELTWLARREKRESVFSHFCVTPCAFGLLKGVIRTTRQLFILTALKKKNQKKKKERRPPPKPRGITHCVAVSPCRPDGLILVFCAPPHLPMRARGRGVSFSRAGGDKKGLLRSMCGSNGRRRRKKRTTTTTTTNLEICLFQASSSPQWLTRGNSNDIHVS